MAGHRSEWRSVVAAGALWAAFYNLMWGVAWFAYMRNEWQLAVDAIGATMPWTAEVWFVWVVLTFPIGIALMKHALDSHVSLASVLAAAMVVWLLLVTGMTVWGIQEGLSVRVLLLDAAVNAVAMPMASLVGAWMLGGRTAAHDAHRRAP